MKLKVLGTQSPYATKNHNCPGFFITEGDAKIMLDCGSGSHRLLNLPEDLNNLHVFISHFHRDHYTDVYNILYASHIYHRQNKLANPVEIYLPMVTMSRFEDIVSEESAFVNYNKVIDEYPGVKVGKLDISFCLTGHTTESYAFKVTDGESTMVYTSDISFASLKMIVDFAKDADLLICESSLLEAYGFPEINPHLTAKQAAIIAKEANVKQLMLTHFWPEEDPQNYVKEAKTVFKNVAAANEGDIIDVNEL